VAWRRGRAGQRPAAVRRAASNQLAPPSEPPCDVCLHLALPVPTPFSNPVHNLPQIHLPNRRRTQRQPHPHLLEHHGAAPGSRGARSRLDCPRWPSTAHASRRPPSPGRGGVEQLNVPPAQIRQSLRRAGAARSRREARGRRRRRSPGYVLFLLQQRPRPSLSPGRGPSHDDGGAPARAPAAAKLQAAAGTLYMAGQR
jgi:hypothetical protein